jgi:hypothetical protein
MKRINLPLHSVITVISTKVMKDSDLLDRKGSNRDIDYG